jgi:hypothetical protein
MPAFSEWESFYVIVGSSAGALVGLQFVVITLIADIPIVRDMKRASSAFSTPNIVHFGAVLLLSAFVAAPWREVDVVEDLWGALGLAGVIYAVIVARRMRIQTAYKPEFEDWLFHALLPFAAYATLVGSAYGSRLNLEKALFGVGAAALLLLFIGIHNAWDAVTYHVTVVKPQQSNDRKK